MTGCLSYQTEHLCMTVLAEYHDLGIGVGVKLPFDAPLQLQYDRARGIYNLYIVLFGSLICLRRFTVRTEQHLDTAQLFQIFMIDRDQSHLAQPFTLHTVVHDIAQTDRKSTRLNSSHQIISY